MHQQPLIMPFREEELFCAFSTSNFMKTCLFGELCSHSTPVHSRGFAGQNQSQVLLQCDRAGPASFSLFYVDLQSIDYLVHGIHITEKAN